jgi:hypothetical protein
VPLGPGAIAFTVIDRPRSSFERTYALEKQIDVFLYRRAKFGTLVQLWPGVKRWR